MPEPDVTSDAHLLPLTDDLKAVETRLGADPDNIDLKLERADALDRLGDVLFNDQDLTRARFFYWESFTARLEVMKLHPDDPAIEAHFAVGLDKLGLLLGRLEKFDDADGLLTEAIERRRRLADYYDDIANSHLIVVSLMRKAALEHARQRPEAERPLLEEAQSRLKQAIARWPDQTFLAQDYDDASARLKELDANKK
jgi:tetratricopeptide (TPR) repeat protein